MKLQILHLELVNASPSRQEILMEEAAVGTSIVVIVIVTCIMVVLLLGSISAFVSVKYPEARIEIDQTLTF